MTTHTTAQARAGEHRSSLMSRTTYIGLATSVILVLLTAHFAGWISISIGLTGVVVTLLLALVAETEHQASAYSRSFGEVMDRANENHDLLRRTLDNLKLSNEVDQYAWLREPIQGICRSIEDIHTKPELVHFREESQRRVRHYAAVIDGMAHGAFDVDDPYETLERRTEAAEKTIKAITIQGFHHACEWNTPPGKRYWLANQQALMRGATIERIFVYDDWAAIVDTIREQADYVADSTGHRMVVWTVENERVRDPRLLSELVIWDDDEAFWYRQNAFGNPTIGRLAVDGDKVQACIHQFSMLRHLCERVEPSR